MCNSLIINHILMLLIFMVNQDKTKIKKQYDLFTINDKLIDSLIEKVEVNDNSFDWYIRCSKNNDNGKIIILNILKIIFYLISFAMFFIVIVLIISKINEQCYEHYCENNLMLF